ncbi:MAG TPA: MaoC family dehydratase [Dehalococcoidia bacterium]|nr:MaoC family dehydratase [Dehalococcoidia bacterium]
MKEGASLPEIKRIITQQKINQYAEASRDFNPIHIDEEFARKTPLGGTIAHGMLVLAYISQVMTAAFGRQWLSDGRLNVRFKAPARPGDSLTAGGRICRVERSAGQTLVNCEVFCRNQNGEAVIIGEATVRVGEDENSS